MTSRLIIAAGDISSSSVLARKFRGKTAKEIYRCGKGVVMTGSFAKPIGYAVATIPAELGKGFIHTAVGHVGEAAIGYLSGVGLLRFLYKVAQPEKLKATARVLYNVGSLPITIYYKGVGTVFDYFQLSKLEKLWFGEPVYIFDDNRLWVEQNFTLNDIFNRSSILKSDPE